MRIITFNHLDALYSYLGQIALAFERIANCFFYFFLVIIAVAILGINIWTVRSYISVRDVLHTDMYDNPTLLYIKLCSISGISIVQHILSWVFVSIWIGGIKLLRGKGCFVLSVEYGIP